MNISKVTDHLKSLALKNKVKDCSVNVGNKIKINSCNLLNKQIIFTLPLVFSGKDIDNVLLFSTDVLYSFREEYLSQKLPYKIDNGLTVNGDITTIEETQLVKGEVVVNYNLKIQLTLK